MKIRRTLGIAFILSFMLALIFALSVSAIGTGSFTVNDGIIFDENEDFVFNKALTDYPLVIETTVKFPEGYSGYGGIVFSSLPEKGRANTMMLEIQAGGIPRFRLQPTNDHTYYTFSSVNVYTGDWVELRFVFDTTAGKVHCYVGGELAQSLDMKAGTFPYTMTRKITVAKRPCKKRICLGIRLLVDFYESLFYSCGGS